MLHTISPVFQDLRPPLEPVLELVQYEYHFGALPEWLEDLPRGRKVALVQLALDRGVPLAAADVIH